MLFKNQIVLLNRGIFNCGRLLFFLLLLVTAFLSHINFTTICEIATCGFVHWQFVELQKKTFQRELSTVESSQVLTIFYIHCLVESTTNLFCQIKHFLVFELTHLYRLPHTLTGKFSVGLSLDCRLCSDHPTDQKRSIVPKI